MKKSIDRTYELSAAEVKKAVYRYLKDFCAQPLPADPESLQIKWNAPGDIFVSFHEFIDLETGKAA
jgi:hypothetical protein